MDKNPEGRSEVNRKCQSATTIGIVQTHSLEVQDLASPPVSKPWAQFFRFVSTKRNLVLHFSAREKICISSHLAIGIETKYWRISVSANE